MTLPPLHFPSARATAAAAAALATLLALAGPARAQAPAPAQAAVSTPGQARAESLQALLGRVLSQDPQVRVAQLQLQVLEDRRLQARSRLGPNISLSSSYGRSVDQELGLQIHRRTERTEAGLRWNLYNGGNDLAEFRAASRDVVAASEDLRRAREEVAERVATAYVELQRIDQLLPRARERVDALRRLAGQVQRQFEAGRASDADAQQAQASMLDAQIVLEQLEADGEAARQRLAALTGGEAGPTVPVALATTPATADPTALPRPGQVLAAQSRALAARQRVRPMAALLAPRVDLEYRRRLADSTTPLATTQQVDGWLLSARWDIPVAGELQARQAEALHRAEAVEAEAERVLQTVQSELVTLAPRIAQSQRAVGLLERQVAQYDALVRAGELQFEAGRRSLAQLMQLHDSRFNAEQRRSDQSARLLGARLRQLALLGELLPALGLDSAAGTR